MMRGTTLLTRLRPRGADALRSPFLRAYAAATLLSNVGVHADSVARVWLASDTSLFAVGLLGLASNGSDIACGWWMSRTGRLRNMAVTLIRVQCAYALVALGLGMLAWNGMLRLEHLLLASVIKGSLNAPARAIGHALAVRAVPQAQVPSVSAVLSTLGGVARLTGPAVGGVLLALGHPAWVFLVNALTFVPLIVLLRGRRSHKRSFSLRAASPGPVLRAVPQLRRALLAVLTPGLFGIPYLTLLPGVARALGGSGMLGALWSAVGLGALVGGLISVQVGVRRGAPPSRALAALGGVQVSLIGVLGLHLSVPAFVSLGVVALIAAANAFYLARLGAYVGVLSARGDGARIFATYYVALLGAMAVAEPLLGALGDQVGVARALVCIASCGLLWCSVLAFRLSGPAHLPGTPTRLP